MINLKSEFGSKYKLFYDPSWDAESADVRTECRKDGSEAWYYELRGPKVRIYPLSATTCGAVWTGIGNKELLRASISSLRLWGEVRYIIANERVGSILDNVSVTRRRVVTDAMRAHGKALAAKYGFEKRAK